MDTYSLLLFLLALLVAERPLGHAHDRACAEPDQQYSARAWRHLDAAASVAFDEDERPLAFGSMARERSLVQQLAIAHHESQGFCRGVDTGERKGDHGQSMCAMGIMTFAGKADGYRAAMLLEDLRVCYLVGYHRMSNSWPRCTAHPYGRLRTYASGGCDKGSVESKAMIVRANQWWARAQAAWQAGKIQSTQFNTRQEVTE